MHRREIDKTASGVLASTASRTRRPNCFSAGFVAHKGQRGGEPPRVNLRIAGPIARFTGSLSTTVKRSRRDCRACRNEYGIPLQERGFDVSSSVESSKCRSDRIQPNISRQIVP